MGLGLFRTNFRTKNWAPSLVVGLGWKSLLCDANKEDKLQRKEGGSEEAAKEPHGKRTSGTGGVWDS